jgi:hypothetical protein
MNKFFLLCIVLLITVSLTAQERINYAYIAPEIDGFPEDVWEDAKAYPIDKPFKTENPTVTATWQALYDDENFYVLVMVEDDDHWPGWQANGESTQYDMPEIFWDVNELLNDGKGAKDVSSGHYRLADGFADGKYDEPITKAPNGAFPGGTYCYSLIGDGYVYELSVPLANLKDGLGNVITPFTNRRLGFDVTIIDQDEGTTTSRQRCVWSNDGNGNNGSVDDSWNNMDGAEVVKCVQSGGPANEYYLRFMYSYSNLPSGGGQFWFTVTAYSDNYYWSAASDQPWLVVNTSSNYGSGRLVYSLETNSGEQRYGHILINSIMVNYTITVTQQAGNVVGISKNYNKGFVCFPNCTNNQISIEESDRIELFSISGILIKEANVEGKTVSVAELPNGLYMVKAYKKGQFVGMAKIIKN